MKKVFSILLIACGVFMFTEVDADVTNSSYLLIVKDKATNETDVIWDDNSDCITILVVEEDGSFETDFIGDC